MVNLELVDAETGFSYIIDVNEEEERAREDALFATQLLEAERRHRAAIENATHCTSPASEEANSMHGCEVTEADGFRWGHEAILLLLSIYKEKHLTCNGKISMKKVWDKIASCMEVKGFLNITGGQCKSKINGMKKTYKSVKDHNGKSGNNRKTWQYFEAMDEIFGGKPWMAPVAVILPTQFPC